MTSKTIIIPKPSNAQISLSQSLSNNETPMSTQAPGYSSCNPINLDSESNSESDSNFEDALNDFSQKDIKCENSNGEHIWQIPQTYRQSPQSYRQSPQSYMQSSPSSTMQATPTKTNSSKDKFDYLAKNSFVFVESLGYFYSEKGQFFVSSDSRYADYKLSTKSKQSYLDFIRKTTKQSPYYNQIERESNIVNVATIPNPIPGIDVVDFAFCDTCKETRNVGRLPVKCPSHGYMRRGEGYKVESGGFFLLKEYQRRPSLPDTPPPSTPNVTVRSPARLCSSPIFDRSFFINRELMGSRFTNRALQVQLKGSLITNMCVSQCENMTANAFLQKYANIVYIPYVGLYWHEHKCMFLVRNSAIVRNSLSTIIDRYMFLEIHMQAVLLNSNYWHLLTGFNALVETAKTIIWLNEPLQGIEPLVIHYCPNCINSAITDGRCEVDNLNALTGMGYRMEQGSIFLLKSSGEMTGQRRNASESEYIASDSDALFVGEDDLRSVDLASDMETFTVDDVQEGDFRSFDEASDSDIDFADDNVQEDEELIDLAIDNVTESHNDESEISAYDTDDDYDNEHGSDEDLLYDNGLVSNSTVSGWSQLKSKGIIRINNLVWSRGKNHFLDISSSTFRSFLSESVSHAQCTQMLEHIQEYIEAMPQYYRLPEGTKGRTFEISRAFSRLPPTIHTYCSECGFVIGFNENNENIRSTTRHAKNTGHDRFISREGYAIKAATGFNLLVIFGSNETISTGELEDSDFDDEELVIPSFEDESETNHEYIVEPYSTDEEETDCEQESRTLPPPTQEEQNVVAELLEESHSLVYDPIHCLYYYITNERYIDVDARFFKNILEEIGDGKSRIRNLVERVISTQIIDSSKFQNKITRGHIYWSQNISQVASSKKLCYCKQCYQVFKTKTAFSRHRRERASMVDREYAGHDKRGDFQGYLIERPRGLYYAIGIQDEAVAAAEAEAAAVAEAVAVAGAEAEDEAQAQAAAPVQDSTGPSRQWVMGGPGWTVEEYEGKVKWLEGKLGMAPDQYLARHNYLLVKELGLYYDFKQKWFRSISHRLVRKVFFGGLMSSVRNVLISYMLHNMGRKYEYMLAPSHHQHVVTLEAAVKYDGPVVVVEDGIEKHLDFKLVDNCVQPTKYYMCHVCKFISHHARVSIHIKQAKHQREEGPEKHIVYGYSVRNAEAKTNYFRIQDSSLVDNFFKPTKSIPDLRSVDPFLSRYKAHEYTKYRSFLNKSGDKRWPRLVQLCKTYVSKKRLSLTPGSSLSVLITNSRFCSTPNSASPYGPMLARFLYVAMKMCELKEHQAMKDFDQVFCANKKQGLRRFFSQMKIFGVFWLLSPVQVLQEDDANCMEDVFMRSLMVCLIDEAGVGFKITSYRCDFCCAVLFAFKCIAVDVMKKDESYIYPFVQDCNKTGSISLNFGRFCKFNNELHSLSPRTIGRTIQVMRVGDKVKINGFEVALDDIKRWVHAAIEQYVLETQELFKDIILTPAMAMHEMVAAQKKRVVGVPMTGYRWDQRDIDTCLENNSVDKSDSKSLQYCRRRLSRLNDFLFYMILLTCGSPYRLTELYSVLIRDAHRLGSNVFVADGMLGLFTNNGKNTMKYSRVRPIVKMLPEEVSECLAHYIYFVRPFEHKLVEYEEQTGSMNVTEFENLSDKYKLHLFMGEKNIKSSTVLGKSFRQFMASTTPYLRGLNYGEIRQVLSYLVAENVSGMVGLQIIIDKALAEQAGHSFNRFVESYATNRDGYNHVMLRRMRDCSAAWHKCLEMSTLQIFSPSIWIEDEPPKLTGEELLDAGRQMFGQHFKFKKGQQRAASDVANCFSMTVAINSGKTTCCIIAMLAELSFSRRQSERGRKIHLVTILVVPYISILNSTIRQLTELGFKVRTFRGVDASVNDYDVLLMSVEDGQLRYLNQVIRYFESTAHQGRSFLRRVVIDDAHILQMKDFVVDGNRNVPVVFLTSFLPQVSDNSMRTLFSLNRLGRVSSQEPSLPHKEYILFKKPNTASINQMILNRVRSLGSALVLVQSNVDVLYLEHVLDEEDVLCIGICGEPQSRTAALNKMVRENIKVVVATAQAMVGLDEFEARTVLFAYSIKDPIELLVGSQLSSGKVEMVLYNTSSSKFQRDLLDSCVNIILMRHMRLTEESCYDAGKEQCHFCVNKRRRLEEIG
ncbi:ATP-dependent DNA helicase [Scheffersomyces stipitis CBS 6054]|uniref:ATP-dependent DNA helicase n=1 Tax=Scheffersomyces stipitis (strain ATCC 58785 / CBS 6054 / NBRC 10063 / NRRL Y-11545) TaxID=322104 RepID=A3LMR4_PICST|nr:ATP-dependent DNA helicase [Scheffersomyces stipitis CBS 6054]XP_001383965.2 ATP-dependent DNA helicase [Scheffersomyces stipitis CBS 6054]ABN64199.2 ATP-dependent DNA helicase [Scheffersomyces stipitis CBS 6054]ABN65936.2 ATP-dependent DNA helicase [Scheffersomyces stipitis CBS 6054]